MNLRNLFKRERRAAEPSWDALADRGAVAGSGAYVDAKAAESISTVYACVSALSESTACLPLHVYRRNENGDRDRADGHWLSRLLDRPNEYQTGMEFRDQQTATILLHGAAYARKEFNGAGEVVALHPLHPQRMTIVRLDSGRHRFDYTDEAGKVQRLLQDEVFAIRDRTEPGSLAPKSRIKIARDTLGMSLALRQHGSQTFKRGARPSAVIENERATDFTTEQMQGLKNRLDTFASGGDNAGRTMVLMRGLKWHNVGLSNEDSEWIAAQQFSVEEVARIFRIPPTMIGDLRHGNYSNTLELGQQFVRFSLQPWLTRWEEAISRSLLGPIARQRYYAEHAVEGLLRAQPKERSEFYGNAIRDGWMDVEEVRRLENLPQRSATPAPQVG